jgi:hypothetical protein
MSDKVAKAFEEFLRTRRDHRDGLSARQQLWTAFEAGAQFTLDEIRERTGLTAPTPETIPAPEPPEKTWDCICGRSNYVTYTRCDHCGFQRATANR